MDSDPVSKAVEMDAACGHLRHIFLEFEGLKTDATISSCQEKRKDPCAGTEVGHMIAGIHTGEIRQQDGVHSKPEAALLLYDPQSGQLQIVHALAFPDQFSGPISSNWLVRQ